MFDKERIEDIESVRHGDKPLRARLFKPRGSGPFPLIVELHGGAWTEGFITRNPTSPAAGQAVEKIVEFVHKQIW